VLNQNLEENTVAYWLVKTEPSECSIDDFAAKPDQPIVWEGVRNYQARNFMRQMAVGDLVLIYHSSCKDIGVAGVVRVVREAYADPAQFAVDSMYYDENSSPQSPRWDAVDLLFVEKLVQLVSLQALRTIPALCNLALVKKGSRLSVMPVSDSEWRAIVSGN
jgi:predicted RNA-binding protein with PUA-like domain